MRGKVEIKIPGWIYEKLEELVENQGEIPEKVLIGIVKKKLIANRDEIPQEVRSYL